jgi:hypothetical protein
VAREILARLFNKGGDLLAIRRYAMSGQRMRTMMLLKRALRSLREKRAVEKPAKSTIP